MATRLATEIDFRDAASIWLRPRQIGFRDLECKADETGLGDPYLPFRGGEAEQGQMLWQK